MPRRSKGPRLYLRHAGTDRASWSILDGSTERRTGCGPNDRAGAERALADYIASKYEPPRKKSSLAELRVSDVVNVYLREHGPNVIARDFLAATAEPVIIWWSDKTLADIRGQTCRQYVEWRTAQRIKRRRNEVTASIATARHDLKTLRAAILYYHREYGPLDAVPAITLPKRAASKERWLTWQEAHRLLRAANEEHLRRFIVLGLHTGTRSAAILSLRWVPSTHSGWVDVERGVLHRKGGAEAETKKARPTVAIEPRLLRQLRAWHAADMANGQTRVIHYNQHRVAKLRRSWDSARTRAGLGPDVTPHTLRHTATTWLLRSGRDPWQVAGYVGMTLDTLEQVYGHHSPRLIRKAAKRG